MSTRRQTFGIYLFVALGFAMSSMSLLRVPGVPLGVSELILIGCIVVHVPLGLGVHGGNVPNRFVPWLIALFFATLPGFVLTLIDHGQVPFTLYNLIASLWLVVLFVYVHYGFDFDRVGLEPLVRLVLGFSTLYFLAVIALSFVEPSLVYLQDDIAERLADAETTNAAEEPIFRLVGFSANPNQLGMHAVVCLFFTLHLWRSNGTLVSFVCLGSALAVGLLAKSDAFLFSAIAMLGLAIVGGIVFGRSVVLAVAVLLPAMGLGAIALPTLVGELNEITQAGDQDSVRFTLWRNGIEAGIQSPLFGLGPGAWSGDYGPRELEEAHNSLIDYFTNAGTLGLTLMLVGVVVLLWRALIAQRAVLFAGAVGILLFAMFHNVLRQPLFWLGLYFVAQNVWPGGATSGRRGPAGRRSSGRRRTRRPSSRGLPV